MGDWWILILFGAVVVLFIIDNCFFGEHSDWDLPE